MSDAIDILTAKVERLQKQLTEERQRREEAEQRENSWIRAAVYATMPHEFGLAFDPTSPMAWAESRRSALDALLTERDAIRSQLATCRADTVRGIREFFVKQSDRDDEYNGDALACLDAACAAIDAAGGAA